MTRKLVLYALLVALAGCHRKTPQAANSTPEQSIYVDSAKPDKPSPVDPPAQPALAESRPDPTPPPAPPVRPHPRFAQRAAPPDRPAPQPEAPPESQPAAVATPAPMVIPAGTLVHVRLDEKVDTKRFAAGDRFTATLEFPISVNGRTVISRGAQFEGVVVVSKRSGRLKGHATLELELDSVLLNGRRYPIQTSAYERVTGGHRQRDAIYVGSGTGFGALVGAVAGGPVAAWVGASAGAAAGATSAFVTGRKNVTLPAEARLTFSLLRGLELPPGT